MFDPSRALKKMLGPSTNVPSFGKPNKFDFDGDGISNKRDCQPRNPVRQDSNEWVKTKVKHTGGFGESKHAWHRKSDTNDWILITENNVVETGYNDSLNTFKEFKSEKEAINYAKQFMSRN